MSGEDVSYSPPQGWSRLRLDVQWDGRDFVGWQFQPAGRNVQGVLHDALGQFAHAARPVAAGRTDAGVHALCMPVHVDVQDGTLRPPPARVASALNSRLPPDVSVLTSDVAPEGFHARYSCSSRSYVYRIVRGPQRLPLEEGRALRVPAPLDVNRMREAAGVLIGRHDFAAFATQEDRPTVREVLRLEVVERGTLLEVQVTGQSFLRHMVRALVGTLLLAGEGRLTAADVQEVLRSGDRRRAGPNVPPHGLYFVDAEY